MCVEISIASAEWFVSLKWGNWMKQRKATGSGRWSYERELKKVEMWEVRVVKARGVAFGIRWIELSIEMLYLHWKHPCLWRCNTCEPRALYIAHIRTNLLNTAVIVSHIIDFTLLLTVKLKMARQGFYRLDLTLENRRVRMVMICSALNWSVLQQSASVYREQGSSQQDHHWTVFWSAPSVPSQQSRHSLVFLFSTVP